MPDHKMIIWRHTDGKIPDELMEHLKQEGIVKTKENKKPTHKLCKIHSIESHNYHIDRGRLCPYCLIGSKPVPKAMMDGGV